MKEEAGIDIGNLDDIDFRIIDLGEMIVSKDNKNKEHLIAIDVTGLEEKEPETDGSIAEGKSENFWVSEDELKKYIKEAEDSYLATIGGKYLFSKTSVKIADFAIEQIEDMWHIFLEDGTTGKESKGIGKNQYEALVDAIDKLEGEIEKADKDKRIKDRVPRLQKRVCNKNGKN